MLQIKNLKKQLEEKACQYFSHHPIEALLCFVVVPPVGVLLAVAFFTILFVVPIGLLFGWF